MPALHYTNFFFFFFFFSSTTLYEVWLAQLFLSIVSSLAPSVLHSHLSQVISRVVFPS
jgi:hypothetical protein